MHALIADHNSRERATLVELCNSRGGLDNLIVVESGTEALAQIRAIRPQVALLACELKDMTGFDVLRALETVDRPATIMVAPDDRYVADALLSTAIDYLTRPISPDRLALALDRARSKPVRALKDTAAQGPFERTRAISRFPSPLPLGLSDRLVGERAGRFYFLSPRDIDYIEVDNNYIMIHAGSECYINRDSLRRLSTLLADVGFVRISRSVLLNLQRVSFAEREGRQGVLAFVLQSGGRVVSSAGFRLEAGAQLRVARTRGTRRKQSVV